MQFTRPLLTASLLGISLNATALPFATYETRSAGMGTVGVASSNIASAPFSNPAMLAAQRFEDDFSLTAGLGVNILGLQVDAAVMGNDNNLSGFVQMGLQF